MLDKRQLLSETRMLNAAVLKTKCLKKRWCSLDMVSSILWIILLILIIFTFYHLHVCLRHVHLRGVHSDVRVVFELLQGIRAVVRVASAASGATLLPTVGIASPLVVDSLCRAGRTFASLINTLSRSHNPLTFRGLFEFLEDFLLRSRQVRD